MKLKHFIIIGYLTSTFITLLSVIWAVNQMLIPQNSEIFIISATIAAGFIGLAISLLLLSQVFTSLHRLKQHIHQIPNQQFEMIDDIHTPVEFREFANGLNEMNRKLKQTFQSLSDSEKEKTSSSLSFLMTSKLLSLQFELQLMGC